MSTHTMRNAPTEIQKAATGHLSQFLIENASPILVDYHRKFGFPEFTSEDPVNEALIRYILHASARDVGLVREFGKLTRNEELRDLIAAAVKVRTDILP